DRKAAGSGAARRPEAPLKAGRGYCHAAAARGCNGGRGGERDRLATPYRSRRLLGKLEEKARAPACLSQRRTRPRLPHRTGERMTPPTDDASAPPPSGGAGPRAARAAPPAT